MDGRPTSDPTLLASWFKAARRGDCDTLKGLLGVVPVDARDEDGTTALAWVVRPFGGSALAVELLLAAGADVNIRSGAHESLVDLCFEGVSSAMEHGWASANAARIREAGFRRESSDAPAGEPGVRAVLRRCESLDAEELAAVERVACEEAVRIWQETAAAWPVCARDPASGATLTLDPELPARALAAATGGDELPESALEAPLRALLLDGELHLSDTRRAAWFAAYNLYRRRVLGDPDVSPALVICLAVHAVPREERSELLDDVILLGLEAVDGGPG